MLDKEEFRSEVSKALKEALAGVSAEARLDDKVKTLLESADSTISDLLETVESKDQDLSKAADEYKSLQLKMEELVGKVSELEGVLAERDSQLKEVQDKVVAAEERASAAEAELTGIANDRRLEVRVAELAEAKILKSGEKAETQKSKVREMSDEEFASYKEELIDLRQSVEAALKEVAAGSGDGKEVEVAPPLINKEEAAAAALNAENNDPTGKSKFKDLGEALAKRLKNKE